MSMLDDLYKPDYKSKLTTQIVGRPGSGKSFYLKHTILEFMKRNKDPNYRLIFICPKQEMYFSEWPNKRSDDSPPRHKKGPCS